MPQLERDDEGLGSSPDRHGHQEQREDVVGEDQDNAERTTIEYDVVALQMTIYFNEDGDHDHNGMLFALMSNRPILRYLEALSRQGAPRPPGSPAPEDPAALFAAAHARSLELGLPLPVTPAQARRPHPLVRPLVLRARRGERVRVRLRNHIRDRQVGVHLVGGGYDVTTDDGSHVGENASSLVPFEGQRVYVWSCDDEGVFPFHDGGNMDGGEDGTNVHGLFGALIVEPEGTTWRDPVTGRGSHGDDAAGDFVELDGLHLDILPPGTAPTQIPESGEDLSEYEWPEPEAYPDRAVTAHREFTIFFHDEPEFVPAHGGLEQDPCAQHGHHRSGDDGEECGCCRHCCGASEGCSHRSAAGAGLCPPSHMSDQGHGQDGRGHGGAPAAHEDLPIMAVSYRSEPMVNRERRLWRLLRTGHVLDRPVLNEEQHHSSWMFGDPADHLVLRAYIGDPVRIRFVHAAVKETHVFHLHLYEWHAVVGNNTSPRIDAISVSPQTAHTIDPVWGAGNRQQVAGDVIWHCHLYPHFHEGMWGIFRTFETRQYGHDGPELITDDPVYDGRRVGRYPDGIPIAELLPLPQNAPPEPTAELPGYPLYIPGRVRQKSPRPPWPDRELSSEELDGGYQPPCEVTSLLAPDMPPDFDYRSTPTDLERSAFNDYPVPGELFTHNPFARQQAAMGAELLERNTSREVCHNVVVSRRRIEYNHHGWHDKHGHMYHLESAGDPGDVPGPNEPLFLRSQHGQILNMTLRNALPLVINRTEFDPPFPPCPQRPWEGECSPHVHMVKFDPICADGASVGWNYMSGARVGRRMVHRWWADQEFGTIFFHDHLFANYRQKHGLFGALIVEPAGSSFFHHLETEREIVTGLQARIRRHPQDPAHNEEPWFREFCIGIADFIPMWNATERALNPPEHPGGHGDQGVMALNYRSEPLRERPGDPAFWFSSQLHGDPATTVFQTYAQDPLWFRIVQGSHEESHSLQVHGLRWQRFRDNLESAIRNQQTTGIAEAWTFKNRAPIRQGDYLYKLSGADDLWLGCWGLVRAHPRPGPDDDLHLPTLPIPEPVAVPPNQRTLTFHVTAVAQALSYRDDLIDPYGLRYRLDAVQVDGGQPVHVEQPAANDVVEPLALWCQEGDRVELVLSNALPVGLHAEPFAPEVPVEGDRHVSSHVSMHADLVAYDVRTSDGANVGLNPIQSVPPGGGPRTYTWDTSRPTGVQVQEPLGPVLLQDMADVRNHRHHGLIGALVVLPAGATPHPVAPDESTSVSDAVVWYGARVSVDHPDDGGRTEEMVALAQDGLRLFLNGNEQFPLPDPPVVEPGDREHEDQGQKGINYRSEPRGRFDPDGKDHTLADVVGPGGGLQDPSTPVWLVPRGRMVRFHLVGAMDKPRATSFTIHGVSWREHRFDLGGAPAPMVGSESAITCGTVRTFEFTPEHVGDHAFRSGALRWAVEQGMWGILRVT